MDGNGVGCMDRIFFFVYNAKGDAMARELTSKSKSDRSSTYNKYMGGKIHLGVILSNFRARVKRISESIAEEIERE